MKFNDYIQNAWRDHATETARVAASWKDGFALVETAEQLAQFAGLITHVMGEHLGRFADGIGELENLKRHHAFNTASETDAALARSIAILKIGSGQDPEPSSFQVSDRIRILAGAAGLLGSQNSKRAGDLLKRALQLAEMGLPQADPAIRALAVTGNNLACSLEEKISRDKTETDLMILAAQTGRRFWELAGGWLEVSLAEYRLTMSYLQASNLDRAFQHAQTCVEICLANKASDLDLFFAFEALARAEHARANSIGFEKALTNAREHFAKLNDDEKKSFQTSLAKLDELRGGY